MLLMLSNGIYINIDKCFIDVKDVALYFTLNTYLSSYIY